MTMSFEQQPLLEKRLQLYSKAIKEFYLSNPDSSIYSKKYIETLAQCMASKIVYGTEYPDDIKSQLTRLNYGAGRRTIQS